MGRAPCCDKTNVKKGPWSPEEDAKLKAYIEQNGTGGNWIALPQKIGLKRCGKSCRLRWLNYLRPNIKHGGFSEEEDNIICSLYISIGSRWSIIAAQLPGRTDNDIKNYWNTRLKKKLLGKRRDSQIAHRLAKEDDGHLHDLSSVVVSQTGDQPLSSSALERMQLHLHFQSLKSPYSIFNPLACFNSVTEESSVPHDGNLNPVVQNQQFETHSALGIESLTATLEKIDRNADSFQCKEVFFTEFPSSGSAADTRDAVQSLGLIEGFPAEIPQMMHSDHEQVDRFDALKEMDGSMLWWGNETDQKVMNSWDSSCALQHEAFSLQDLALEYGLL